MLQIQVCVKLRAVALGFYMTEAIFQSSCLNFLCMWRIVPTYSQSTKHVKKYGIKIFDSKGHDIHTRYIIFCRFLKFLALMPTCLHPVAHSTFMEVHLELTLIPSTMQIPFSLPTRTRKSVSGKNKNKFFSWLSS